MTAHTLISTLLENDLDMSDITQACCAEMQEKGWWKGSGEERQYVNEPATAWDVNCGDCENWVQLAQMKYGGEECWLDDHVVLLLHGRYYDSQHPKGVDDWHDLDVVRQVSREDWLNKQSK